MHAQTHRHTHTGARTRTQCREPIERRYAQAIAEEQLDGVLSEQYWREVRHAFRLARVPEGGRGGSKGY